jgi:RNA polymerase sigma-54 factor
MSILSRIKSTPKSALFNLLICQPIPNISTHEIFTLVLFAICIKIDVILPPDRKHIMLKQELSQRLQQKLSPQQIQFMKLLQIPTAALDQRIKEELESNPALEEGDFEDNEETEPTTIESDQDSDNEDADRERESDAEQDSENEAESDMDADYGMEDYMNAYMEDDPESYQEKVQANQEEEKREAPLAMESSLHDYLIQQISMLQLSDEISIQIAKQIIGSIDDDGYLRREISAISDDLLFSLGTLIEEKEIERVLQAVQKLDPPGIGARDLRECLKLQLIQKLELQPQDNYLALALKIIDRYFTEFSKRHFEKLMRSLDIDDETLRCAMDEIVKLNPKPASGYNPNRNEHLQYIIPDFIITNRDGELELTLHSQNYPDLKVSDRYRQMLKTYVGNDEQAVKSNRQEKEAILFLKQKIDSAKWFIDAIQKRYNTMYRIMYTIMQAQYEYFVSGDDRKLKPMILKDIADVTGLDISTVSRVANNKYVQTEFGTRIVKDFFSESVQNTDGEEVSTLEVKYLLTELVKNEDKRNPLSDEELKELLKEKGFDMARRTIAKYREQLNISVARLRKIL